MSVATDNNAAASAERPGAVERALAAAIRDGMRIGELLDALRLGRLWLPLAGDGTAAVHGDAVTLPTVTYLGCEFIPAYTSAELLAELAGRDRPGRQPAPVPHIAVNAAGLARLLPPDVGIALNVGAAQSVPVYPQGVAYLAAGEPTDARRITVGPLPAEPVELLALIRAGLARIPQARSASAGWLSVQFAGEGMVVSVTLDDPADAIIRAQVIVALEQAAGAGCRDAGYPIDVTFPGEGEPDHIDHWMATAAVPFYCRPRPDA
jgi:SseB protein N-terminal domain